MTHANSQEQTIYRCLSGQIQSGFYDGGERFPSVQEIARQYGVSYCPAQRALKALERQGFIVVCRGKATQVVSKPYGNYLESGAFHSRAAALDDLARSLELVSADLCLEGMRRLADAPVPEQSFGPAASKNPGKQLYQMFELALKALENRTVLNLYYDIHSFQQSAFLDLIYVRYGTREARLFLEKQAAAFQESLRALLKGREREAGQGLKALSREFFGAVSEGFQAAGGSASAECPLEEEAFRWEPAKGRSKYCDAVAVDLVCKIHQGIYPVGTLLPNGASLADTYHVSPMTIRRTLVLLAQLGVVKTYNGVGTRVLLAGDGAVLEKWKDLALDGGLKASLESLQLLALTCGPVLRLTLPHITEELWTAMRHALDTSAEKRGMTAFTSACMQTVVRCCPLAALRELYGKITLLLLKAGVLRLGETGQEPVSGWPELALAFRDCLEQPDDLRFTALFDRLVGLSFREMKRSLLRMGIAPPVDFCDYSDGF